jgi:hypothetical protein
MPLVNNSDPFYRPKSRRIAIVAVTAAWAAFETFYARDGFWMIIALAICAYAFWTFILNWKEPPAA